MSDDITFKYNDRIALDAAAGSIANYVFSATGMYDPDITGTGHQPLGFDQWLGLFYNHYTVERAHIRATFFTQDASITGQAIVAIGLSDDTAIGTDLNTLLEQPTYTYRPLGSLGTTNGVVIAKWCDNARFFWSYTASISR